MTCVPTSRRTCPDAGDSGSTSGRRPSATPRSRRTAPSSTSWRDLIARVVKAGVDAGEIGKVDAEVFAVTWTALLDGLVVQVALEDPVVDLKLAKRIALDVAVKELGLD